MAEPTVPAENGSKGLRGRVGKYEILRPLGKGAMGQVYLAHDTVLDRDVALKVMAAQIADDAELKQRFEREARAVAKMTHPNVVTVFDLGSHTDGSPYIAMELLKGQDLQKLMRQTPPPGLERKVAIAVQVLAGLAHAHQAGIVHRDIKPANIFIQEDGSVKIMDFGVARLTAASMTGSGSIVGTADYMSPEQVKAAKVDGRSDLFSVGCVLFELLAGRRPFHADDLMAIFYKITHEQVDFAVLPQTASHQALLPVLQKALAKDVEARYQTAYEFAVDLRRWLERYGASASSRNVLAQIVDLEAPTYAPVPATETPGQTATPSRGGAAADRVERRTAPAVRRPPTGARAGEAAGATVRSAPARPVPPSPRASARAAREPRGPVLPWVATGLALVAVVVAGGLAWQRLRTPASPPASLAPAVTPPITVATPVATPAPVTVAAQPTFAEAQGKAAASIRAAQLAFRAGSYDRAASAAQEALREDPGSSGAQRVRDDALAGRKALAQLSAAEAALAQGDFAAAESQLEAARRLAPWDGKIAAFSARISEARLRAEQDARAKAHEADRAKINALLNEASTAMERKQFDAAVAVYNRVLELEPGNAVAQTGKSNAFTARAIAEAAASASRPAGPASPTRSFVAGRTEAKGPESASGLTGFDSSPGVVVKKGTQAADLPGRLVFDASPAAPKPGERYRITVALVNEGSQPIQIATMSVSTTVDGRRQSGAVPPAAATVAPGGRAVLWQTPGELVWKEKTLSWTMEIVLLTKNHESYRGTLSWK